MKSLNILFVVHRYAPLPGGSEYNTQAMAEAAVQVGHNAYVLAGETKKLGEQNGVIVNNNPAILMQPFDLIVIHGSCPMQDIALQMSHLIKSPKLYLMIGPPRGNENIDIIYHGMKYCQWIGVGTTFDRIFLDQYKDYGFNEKAVPIRYGILPEYATGQPGFKQKHNINTKKMLVAAGGFAPHKQIKELITSYNKVSPADTTLAIFGYDNRSGWIPKDSHNVRVFTNRDRQEVIDAIFESDLLILNSREEGYGIVLLEAMYNKTRWAARPVGIARDIGEHGIIYETDRELETLIDTYCKDIKSSDKVIELAKGYIDENHIATKSTIHDIMIAVERI